MQDRREYWKGREARAVQASKHTEEMEQRFHDEIEASVRAARIYGPGLPEGIPLQQKTPIIQVIGTDSVAAVMDYTGTGNDVAVLNFASYKNPGGMFLQGSKAQEECLCHASTLYNVLRHFDPDCEEAYCESDYYGWNRANKNRSLYCHRAIFTPGVIFLEGEEEKACNVITCAAPNKTAAQKYCGVTDRENRRVLWERIQFVFRVAEINHIQTLILGAYGCGVFGQDPREVAALMKAYIKARPYISRILFAIPPGKDGNLEAFREVWS